MYILNIFVFISLSIFILVKVQFRVHVNACAIISYGFGDMFLNQLHCIGVLTMTAWPSLYCTTGTGSEF